ncbi:6827_t:CDS:2 [Dentiscutata heterogama]|uniref:6827_t:CDS:1 n=1 Tax=Dentiscutata heterogama TaxID=1316150 RepID=A0ACA9K4U6_9GLOM|nr:6827_t:CDS:2 [Dentiscutata heterogama]
MLCNSDLILSLINYSYHYVVSYPLSFYCTRFAPSAVSFNTSIANIASLKVSALQGPCAEITRTGEFLNGSIFTVSQMTYAEPLCLSDVASVQDNRGSSVWFLSPQG